MTELQHITKDFLEDRPSMKDNNTFEQVVSLLLGEVKELQDAHLKGNNREVALEVADVFIFAYTLANILEVDVNEVVREKTAFNHCRYQAQDFIDNDYETARKMGKQREGEVEDDWKDI